MCACTWVLNSVGIMCNFISCIFSFNIGIFGGSGGKECTRSPNIFLRIMHSSPKFQNSVLLGIKATILTHKEVSGVMLSEAGVREPGSNWLERQRNLLSHILRSPGVIQASGLLDLVTYEYGRGPRFFSSVLFAVHPVGFIPWLTVATRSTGFLIYAQRERKASPCHGMIFSPSFGGSDWSDSGYIFTLAPRQCLNLGSGRIELDLLEPIPGAEGGVLSSCIT